MARVEELLRETRETIGIFETRLLLALAMHVRVERLVAHPEEEVTPEAETAFRVQSFYIAERREAPCR